MARQPAPWTTEQVVAALQAAGQPLTSYALADRLAGGPASPPEWWHLAGILERVSYHAGATVLRIHTAAGWCYVHRDHAQRAAPIETAPPLQLAAGLRDLAPDSPIQRRRPPRRSGAN